jgi:excisionase family DNA binding protein
MGLIDIAAVAAALDTTPRHVRSLIYERGLPFVKVGQLVRIDEDDLAAWIEANKRVRP